MAEGPTLYDYFKAAGCKTDSHESDFYVEATPEARAILKTFPLHAKNAKPFRDNVSGKTWLDIPFAYSPYWDKRTGRSTPAMPPGTKRG